MGYKLLISQPPRRGQPKGCDIPGQRPLKVYGTRLFWLFWTDGGTL